jgi:hypothetical protein
VTGECIEAVGGQVRRVYMGQTAGFTDRAVTVEMIAERWNDVMAGASDGLIGYGAMDPTTWDVKPYRPARMG